MYPQLLPLSLRNGYCLSEWIVAPCNKLASTWVLSSIELKTDRAAYIFGETGKTHLANVFIQLLNGHIVCSPSCLPRDLFNNNAVAIDSIENFSEKWLFDAFNILRERNAWTLFLAKSPPQHIILPDLRSRMMSVPSFELGRPDDDLIKGVLIKRLKDFGLLIDDDTLMYLLNRIPRSLAAANEWAERLSTNSAITQRRISKRLVQALLAI